MIASLAAAPLGAAGGTTADTTTNSQLLWSQLPALPDHEGFAAPFAGVSGGALIVAGGANFPGKKPWEGGTKVWYDTVFVLERNTNQWRVAGRLPRPLGYGVSVTTSNGVLCLGGSDAQRHYADAFLLQWQDGQLHTKPMPPLPKPCANLSGALVGNTVYLAGGTESPSATNSLRTFWALDLAQREPVWRELEPWPGPARMLAVAGACEGGFFLFSGVELAGDAQGKPTRRYLSDAYRFSPDLGWKRLADLPRPTVAAPSPAITEDGQLLIVSGDDGRLANFEPKSQHPGFPRGVLAYALRTDRWRSLEDSPLSRATVPVVTWQGRAIIPNGEARPGVRTPEVWTLRPAR